MRRTVSLRLSAIVELLAQVRFRHSLLRTMLFTEGVDNKLLGKRDWVAERKSSGWHTNIWCNIHTG